MHDTDIWWHLIFWEILHFVAKSWMKRLIPLCMVNMELQPAARLAFLSINDWKRENSCLALSKSDKMHLPAPLQLTQWHPKVARQPVESQESKSTNCCLYTSVFVWIKQTIYNILINEFNRRWCWFYFIFHTFAKSQSNSLPVSSLSLSKNQLLAVASYLNAETWE